MNTSKKIRVIAALGTLSGAVWAGTFATFTDTGDAESTFSTGTVVLELNDTDGDYGFSSLSTANMRPGDVKYAPLTVENAGSLSSTYVMTSAESETDLSGELQLGAVTGAAVCNAAGYAAATNVLTGSPANQVIAAGDLSAAAIGTARPLDAGGSETLCFRVELPTATSNDFQDLTTTSTFTFNLTQVAGGVR